VAGTKHFTVRAPFKYQNPGHGLTDRIFLSVNAAGHDRDRAVRLYLWNAQLGEAFHIPIQAVEVGLRNSINLGLTTTFGQDWWQDTALEAILDDERKGDLLHCCAGFAIGN
jgi:hypothetical protein